MATVHPEGPGRWPTHRLLSIAARMDELRINRSLTHLGLTKGALDALEAITELEPANVSDLATLLCVSKQSLGKVLQRLQSLGYLTRGHSGDGRSVIIQLSQRGRSVLATAEGLIHALTDAGDDADAALRNQLERHISELRKSESMTRHGDDPPTTEDHFVRPRPPQPPA